jgi:hypothetical protein
MDSAETRKTWEPEPYTARLKANTDIPALASELSRLMVELGMSHKFDLPYEVSCEVRVTFKNKVSRDDIQRLLKAADAGLWGVDVSCHKDEGSDEA